MRCATASTTAARDRRRGLTLVEMLVTVALMLLIMSIIVTVFSVATGAMTVARTDQELSGVGRRISSLLRQDLDGATARFTPPLDPNDNFGYFEYGENSLADAQDEDTDDYIAFTAKAPPGQPFTGRIMLPRGVWPATLPDGTPHPRAGQIRFVPTTITGEFAEIIYFLRDGNLHRRVLLIVPERTDSLQVDLVDTDGDGIPDAYRYDGGGFDLDGDDVVDVSWQGANDVSARPSTDVVVNSAGINGFARFAPVPNTLGDLTNRENRAFRPGFVDDFFDPADADGDGITGEPDGVFDDLDLDGVPDFYPTLYPNLLANTDSRDGPIIINNRDLEDTVTPRHNLDTLAFPFLFPGAYSVPNRFTANPASIHGGPLVGDIDGDGRPDTNHAPLERGDNLPIPAGGAGYTWWGFPTWSETRSPAWTAATKRLNLAMFTVPFPLPAAQQAFGLSWQRGIAGGDPDLLPPITPRQLWHTDGAGDAFLASAETVALQDDLVATNVRSFDVKALDPNAYLYSNSDLFGTGNSLDKNTAIAAPVNLPNAYRDLGYAFLFKGPGTGTSPLDGTQGLRVFNGELTTHTKPGEAVTFGHEGRIPPLTTDNREDAQSPGWGLGEDFGGTIRMRRVWDSWSTDYTRAPLASINPLEAGPTADTTAAPPFVRRPLYPSYPPPYPSPLRGIQIQIRLAAPDGSRLKVLTIRQDFSDRL